MSILQDIPSFSEQEIRKSFMVRVVPDMTQEAKQSLQNEYNEAVKQAKKQLEIQVKAIAKANTEAFLAQPVQVLEELDIERRQLFDLGELLVYRGVAVVTLKRFGKGSKILVGSDYECTSSNFKVTASIGPHVLTEECSSTNDRYFKDRLKWFMAEKLARTIAADPQGAAVLKVIA